MNDKKKKRRTSEQEKDSLSPVLPICQDLLESILVSDFVAGAEDEK